MVGDVSQRPTRPRPHPYPIDQFDVNPDPCSFCYFPTPHPHPPSPCIRNPRHSFLMWQFCCKLFPPADFQRLNTVRGLLHHPAPHSLPIKAQMRRVRRLLEVCFGVPGLVQHRC